MSATVLSAGSAHAQDVELSTESGDPGPRSPMGWAGIGFKIGIARLPSNGFRNPTYRPDLQRLAAMATPEQQQQLGLLKGDACTILDARCSTEPRTALHLAIPITLGGDGLGFVIEPYFTVGNWAKAYGLYLGPKFEIHVVEPLYIGFGLGVKAAWLSARGWDYGADVYGRLPVHLTWYVHKDFALTAELGWGFGASGYLSKPIVYVDPRDGTQRKTVPSMNFGVGNQWDFTMGFRFP